MKTIVESLREEQARLAKRRSLVWFLVAVLLLAILSLALSTPLKHLSIHVFPIGGGLRGYR